MEISTITGLVRGSELIQNTNKCLKIEIQRKNFESKFQSSPIWNNPKKLSYPKSKLLITSYILMINYVVIELNPYVSKLHCFIVFPV